MMSWNTASLHRDSHGRNIYQVSEPNPKDYCMCSLHMDPHGGRAIKSAGLGLMASVSMSSLSSLNMSSSSGSPSPPGHLPSEMTFSHHNRQQRPPPQRLSSEIIEAPASLMLSMQYSRSSSRLVPHQHREQQQQPPQPQRFNHDMEQVKLYGFRSKGHHQLQRPLRTRRLSGSVMTNIRNNSSTTGGVAFIPEHHVISLPNRARVIHTFILTQFRED
jgi:hypothetical protein